MKTITSIFDDIPSYNLTDEEKKIVIDTYFDQLVSDIVAIDKPEIATLWGTLKLKVRKVNNHLQMIDKILENPVETITEADIRKYKEKKKKLLNLISIQNHIQEHGKTSRSGKRK